jgi:hypothetical protein
MPGMAGTGLDGGHPPDGSHRTAPLGTSIRIFLANGGADGVWIVEKSNWTGKALMAPRTRYKDLRARMESTSV